MSQIYVSVGQTVKITDIIGLEGSTGYSTGSHCHYCCRVAGTMTPLDINAISGIPNVVGGVYDDSASGGTIREAAVYPEALKWWNFKRRFSIVLSKRWKLDNLYKSSNVEYGWYQNQSDKEYLYYLTYRTRNQGQGDFYPYVTSSQDDYAGSNGKPMQLLQIQAFDNNGTEVNYRCSSHVSCTCWR